MSCYFSDNHILKHEKNGFSTLHVYDYGFSNQYIYYHIMNGDHARILPKLTRIIQSINEKMQIISYQFFESPKQRLVTNIRSLNEQNE